MGLASNLETNSLGGFNGGNWGSNFGGVTPVVEIGGRRCDDDCDGKLLLLNAISNIKDDNRANAIAITASIERNKDLNVNEFRAIAKDVCDAKTVLAEKICDVQIETLKANFETERQITALSTKNDAQFTALSVEGERQTAIILAKINQNEEQRLRDEIEALRRRADNTDIDIRINNSNAQTQAQFQAQNNALFKTLERIEVQNARAENSLVNLGTMVGTAQTNTNANTKVNS
jgi:hypothetical protein